MKRVAFITLVAAFILTVAVHWAHHTGDTARPRVGGPAAAAAKDHTDTPPPATEATATPDQRSVPVDTGGPVLADGPTLPVLAPPAPVGDGDNGDDAANDATPPTPAEVATGWALEGWRDSWDPESLPPGAQLGVWSTNTQLIVAATAAGPHADQQRHATISAIAGPVTNAGNGWCTVALIVKSTVDGQVGVATTTATVTVHIASNGLVDADRDLPA